MASSSQLVDTGLSTAPTGLFPKIVQDPLTLTNYNTSSSASRTASEPLLAAAPASSPARASESLGWGTAPSRQRANTLY